MFRRWLHSITAPRGVADPTVALALEQSPFALAAMVRQRFYADRHYARLRRRSWKALATTVRLLIFGLSATSTVLLGLANLQGFAAAGFICSALVTTVSAFEPFFNWRSRWVMADEALAEWHKLEEDLAIHVASSSEGSLSAEDVLDFDRRRREVWNAFSEEWVAQRRVGSTHN